MTGIVFFRTANRERVVAWYTETVGAEVSRSSTTVHEIERRPTLEATESN